MDIKYIFAAAALAAATSCSVDPIATNTDNEQYTQSFIREFGLIDPQQDWNLAERQGVTVVTNRPTEVHIYALIDNVYYLVGHYNDVTGTRLLQFDVPEGSSCLKISAGGHRFDILSGQTINLSEAVSRADASLAYNIAGQGTITVTKLLESTPDNMRNWLRIPADGTLQYREKVPEKRDNRDESFINKNFLYRSKGPFIIHPIYWNTSQKNTLGIYVHTTASDPDAVAVRNFADGTTQYIKRIPVYTIKNDTEVLFKADIGTYNEGGVDVPNSEIVDGVEYVRKDAPFGSDPAKWSSALGGYEDLASAIKGYSVDGDGNVTHSGTTQFMSKGIKVDIPVGMEFGMYIQLSSPSTYTDEFGRDFLGDFFYSEAELNPDPYYERTYRNNSKKRADMERERIRPWQACHAASFIGEEHRALALMFEDWLDNGGSDMDLNDMVFVFFGANPENISDNIPEIRPHENITASPYQWIIAAEDLGSFEDFDFNDVVVGIEHVSGETTASLTPLAAGGTLPVKLLFNGSVVLASDGSEQFHHWFEGNPSETTMINTSSHTYAAKGKVTITVGSDFSIAPPDSNDKFSSMYSGGNMGGFSIEVTKGTGTTNIITPPGTGEAPQMICVPGGWAWPVERCDIRNGYDDFDDWVGDCTKHADWYKTNYNTANLYITPNYGGTSTGGSPSGGSSSSTQEFIVTAPSEAEDGVRTPAAEGPFGYIDANINLSELSDDNVLLKAYRYYWMVPDYVEYNSNGNATNYVYNETYHTNFLNALMRHYWKEVYYTSSTNDVFPDEACSNWGGRFGAGEEFVLLEIISDEPVYSSSGTSNTVRVKARVQQVAASSTPGTGGGGQVAGYTDLTVKEITEGDEEYSAWSQYAWHKGFKVTGATAGDEVELTFNYVSSSYFSTDICSDPAYSQDKIQMNYYAGTVDQATSTAVVNVTLTAGYENNYFFVTGWNGDVLVSARKVNR